MRKIKGNLEGVRNMSRLPGAVVVVDAKKEYIALREAKKLEISTIGLLDTDSDPDTVDVAIPANDDSIRAVDLILNELADAVAIGKTMVAVRQEPAPQRPKRVRSRRSPTARARQEQPVGAAEQTSSSAAESAAPESPGERQGAATTGNDSPTENP
jgi:small subunit ribosomal protein S2